MIQTDIGHEIKFNRAISPHSDNGAGEDGAAIDRLGYQSALLAIDVGAVSGTPNSFAVNAVLYESADGTTGWTSVDDSAITEITTIDTKQVKEINLAGLKRYIKAVLQVEFVNGTSPEVLVAGALILGGADTLPAV